MRKFQGENLVEITCNMCGESYDVDEEGLVTEKFVEVDRFFGYGSTLNDMTKIKFDLCEYCIAKITKEFVVPEEVIEYEIKYVDGKLRYCKRDKEDE